MRDLFGGWETGFIGGGGTGGDWLRGEEGESGVGIGRGGGEARRGSVAGGDDSQELKAGDINVSYLTQ